MTSTIALTLFALAFLLWAVLYSIPIGGPPPSCPHAFFGPFGPTTDCHYCRFRRRLRCQRSVLSAILNALRRER